MTREEATEALQSLNLTIGAVASLLRDHRPTIDRFFDEQRSMDSVGAILDPTLFNSSERRATEAILTPVYRAARDFLDVHDRQIAAAREALATTAGRREG